MGSEAPLAVAAAGQNIRQWCLTAAAASSNISRAYRAMFQTNAGRKRGLQGATKSGAGGKTVVVELWRQCVGALWIVGHRLQALRQQVTC